MNPVQPPAPERRMGPLRLGNAFDAPTSGAGPPGMGARAGQAPPSAGAGGPLAAPTAHSGYATAPTAPHGYATAPAAHSGHATAPAAHSGHATAPTASPGYVPLPGAPSGQAPSRSGNATGDPGPPRHRYPTKAPRSAGRRPVRSATAPDPRSGGHAPARLGYAKGLDGVRALAVVAVLLYHLGTTGLNQTDGPEFVPGGFLGVDVFFVLSGFLITSLLLAERAQTGRISLREFYLRRARRLLPALYTLLIVVALLGAFAYRDRASSLGGDLVASFSYVTNWWLIAQNASYFGGGAAPPMLTHLWSLAVEEQFYLIWPLILIVLTRSIRRLARRWAAVVVTVMILASAGLAAYLFSPWEDPSRVYYGTDTRAATPLFGALLAIVLRPWRWRAAISQAARLVIDAAGIGAVLWLGVATMHYHDTEPGLYRGGFLFVAVVAGVLVVAAAHPASRIGTVLGIAPLRWLGERSYGIYLWHWPLFTVTRPGADWPLDPVSSSLARIALTLLIAALSYRYIEKPLRSGAIGRAFGRWRAATPGRRGFGAARFALATALVLAGGFAVTNRLTSAAPAAATPVGGVDVALGQATPIPSETAGPVPTASASPSASPRAGALTVPAHPPSVGVFGDSQGMTLLRNTPSDIGKYVRFRDNTIEGCGVLLGRVTSRSGERRDLAANCPNWLSQWESDAAATHPDIALIMLGAWDVFDLTVNGTTMTFGSPQWDATWKAALTKGIEALQGHAKRVVVALTPCYRPIRASAGYWPERGDDVRTRHLNDLMRETALATSAYTVDPPVQFCTDPKISKSLSYRWDGVHYYRPGALLFCQKVIPQLLAIDEQTA